jgi:hypothetical protein
VLEELSYAAGYHYLRLSTTYQSEIPNRLPGGWCEASGHPRMSAA